LNKVENLFEVVGLYTGGSVAGAGIGMVFGGLLVFRDSGIFDPDASEIIVIL
jgi:hypothetical protein